MRKLKFLLLYVFTASLFFGCATSDRPETLSISIIATSDVHGLLFPWDFTGDVPADGSLARVYSYVKEQREKPGTEVILLDAGDILQGQPLVYYSNFIDTARVHIVPEVMNRIGYDAIVVGNHDIEAGPAVYGKVVDESYFPWLAANVVNTATGKPWFEPYTVLDIKGVKVAVIGLTTPMVTEWLPEQLWKGMEFKEIRSEAERWMQLILEEEKPDIVIGLFHEGMGETVSDVAEDGVSYLSGSGMIASAVPGFDIIITGHDHRRWDTWIDGPEGAPVYVAGPGSHGRYVAEVTVDLEFNRKEGRYDRIISGNIISMQGYDPDRGLLSEYEGRIREVREYVSRKIGRLEADMSSRESLFGSSPFVDIVHSLQLDMTGADISFAAPLSYDATLEKGYLTVGDMFSLYRFENYLYTMELYGSEIKDYLEYSYGNWFNTMQSKDDLLLRYRTREDDSPIILDSGGTYRLAGASFDFDSAAGIDYTVDVSRPAGQRVTVLRMSSGEPFNADRRYRVAINSYRGSGGGGHLEHGAGLSRSGFADRLVSSTSRDLRHYLMEYIEREEVIHPVALNNWKVLPEKWHRKAKEREMGLLFSN
ncbi:MAG: bifunctional metallophosphatase/5'-nucleotidase [Marinilabiliales bacterium]|nr:MAG: bifunctional metallophosphatase/5'-nucleotidase [Marinilabiliales bacterium]